MSAVRRRLLAAVRTAAAGGPVTVGESAAATAGSQANVALAWCVKNPASGTGFVNSVQFVLGGATTFDYAVLTVSPAGIVTDITSTITANPASGINNIALPAPLAINAGDYIGVWVSGGSFGFSLSYASEAGLHRVYRANSATPKPTPGTDVSGSVPASIANTYFKISAAT